ncbi:MAG: hypothetical protein IPK14_13805 [Blastocatellia bacterium]|nr:hypothetical protein [Blastocatellia bacterium]
MLNRRTFIYTTFLTIFSPNIFSFSIKAAENADFNGVWVLDKEKSVNLLQIFATVQEYLLIIKQDNKTITVSTEFQGRGQKISSEPDTFPMDGTTVEKADRRGFIQKRSFRYNAANELVVETEKVFTGEVQMPNSSENETWNISGEGVLTITITPKNNSENKQVRVFNKKTQSGI